LIKFFSFLEISPAAAWRLCQGVRRAGLQAGRSGKNSCMDVSKPAKAARAARAIIRRLRR
jgi:hypothetical protein